MRFKISLHLIILFFICNTAIAQDTIVWEKLSDVFTKILTTEDFRLTHNQKEERIANADYTLELEDKFFKKESWKYVFDDFFQTDYLIFNVNRFEDYLEGPDENYGLAQMEKIIDQILGKDYIKFKDNEIIEREMRSYDNLLELIEEFEETENSIIQWMHFSDVGKEDFIPLKKSVRIFYDAMFDELTITFNGVDGFVNIPKEGNFSTTGIHLTLFSRLYFQKKEVGKKHPPTILTLLELNEKRIRFEWQSDSLDTEGIVTMPRKVLKKSNRFSFDLAKEEYVLQDKTTVWLSDQLYQDFKKEKEVKLDLGEGSTTTFSKYRKGEFSFNVLGESEKVKVPVWIAISDDEEKELWILDDPQQAIVVKMKNEFEFYLSAIGL